MQRIGGSVLLSEMPLKTNHYQQNVTNSKVSKTTDTPEKLLQVSLQQHQISINLLLISPTKFISLFGSKLNKESVIYCNIIYTLQYTVLFIPLDFFSRGGIFRSSIIGNMVHLQLLYRALIKFLCCADNTFMEITTLKEKYHCAMIRLAIND